MLTRLKALLGKEHEQGFTLIELLIVILIVGILAAVATPLYLGYVKDAKTAEAKGVAGSLWTSVQANAIANCGVATAVTTGYAKSGFSSTGTTSPARWTVTPGGDMTVVCNTGAIGPDETVFTISGAGTADVDFVRVQLVYAAGSHPPSKLRCSTDGGTTFVDC